MGALYVSMAFWANASSEVGGSLADYHRACQNFRKSRARISGTHNAFGTDFGDGVPVAAFQIKKADSDWCTAYAIYSLQKPPHLLRTITGGEFFSASDVNLDGTVEVFPNDAAAVDGFDKLTLGEMDSPPTVVLRLANAHLQDVSAEFQPYFDAQIRSVRATMDAHDLEDFRNSDGALAATAETSLEELHHLRTVKIKVLEIVWAYLYSGREQE